MKPASHAVQQRYDFRKVSRDAESSAVQTNVVSEASDLLFDALDGVRRYLGLEIESVVIITCVTEATIRPIVLRGDRETMLEAFPSDEARGWVSRRAIAERTGLPRETVRRKVKQLVDAGRLLIDDEGRVRATQELARPEMARLIDSIRDAVARYRERTARDL